MRADGKSARVPRKSKRPSPVSPYTKRRFDVVAIGTSAGGFQALRIVLSPVPKTFPSSILVVQHLDPHHRSLISNLLARHTPLQVKQAEHGELLLPGVVYIAPPDEHMLAGPGRIQLVHSQLVHFSRPSIDLLFESTAGTYGSRCVGVVLSGSNKDGADGIRAIKEAGGTTMAQEPESAEFKVMPQAAIATGCVDSVLPLAEIGAALNDLCCGTRAPR